MLDIKKESEEFYSKAIDGYFQTERIQSAEFNYSKEKEERDSIGVKEFLDAILGN